MILILFGLSFFVCFKKFLVMNTDHCQHTMVRTAQIFEF